MWGICNGVLPQPTNLRMLFLEMQEPSSLKQSGRSSASNGRHVIADVGAQAIRALGLGSLLVSVVLSCSGQVHSILL